MSVQNGRAFNEWLRTQLKVKKMSQRQLAQQSGVDHSTISRLVRGDRTPSLGTATKMARGLHELRDAHDFPASFGTTPTLPSTPAGSRTAGVIPPLACRTPCAQTASGTSRRSGRSWST